MNADKLHQVRRCEHRGRTSWTHCFRQGKATMKGSRLINLYGEYGDKSRLLWYCPDHAKGVRTGTANGKTYLVYNRTFQQRDLEDIAWATKIVGKVGIRKLTIDWDATRGRSSGGRISVPGGTDRVRFTILHEIAHELNTASCWAGHSGSCSCVHDEGFHTIAFGLYRKHLTGEDASRARKREYGYHFQIATRVAKQMGYGAEVRQVKARMAATRLDELTEAYDEQD